MAIDDGGWRLPAVINPDRKSFCISVPNEINHIRAFFGAIQSLAEWWNWERDDEHTATLVAQVWRNVANQAYIDFLNETCGEDTMLRQSTNDPCQLEQSIDGGLTWTLAFDFGLCYPPYIQTILRQTDIILENIRDGQSPIQININAPVTTWVFSEGDTTTEADGRLQALCWAVHRIVDYACELAVDAFNNEYSQIDLAQFVLGIGAVIAGALGVSVFSALGFALGIAALEARQNMIESDIDLLEDPDIRDLLSCLMFQNLQPKPVTADAFAQSFSTDATCLTSDEQRAYEIVGLMIANPNVREDMFNAFIDVLGDATSAYKSGVLSASCVCDERSWQYCLPMQDWYSLSEPAISYYSCNGTNAQATPAPGALVTNAGDPVWQATLWMTGQTNSPGICRKMRIYVPSGTEVNEVFVHLRFIVGGGNTDSWAKRLTVNASQNCFFTFGSNPFGLTGLTVSGEMMEVEINLQFNGLITSQNLAIDEIKFIGTGIPLFGVCDNC